MKYCAKSNVTYKFITYKIVEIYSAISEYQMVHSSEVTSKAKYINAMYDAAGKQLEHNLMNYKNIIYTCEQNFKFLVYSR